MPSWLHTQEGIKGADIQYKTMGRLTRNSKTTSLIWKTKKVVFESRIFDG
jgi:hypothetical protein